MLATHERHSKAKLFGTILSIMVIIGLVMIVDHVRSTKQAAAITSKVARTTVPTPTPTPAPSASTTSNASVPQSASYNASSTYQVPSGSESIAVELTITGGIITDASIQNSERGPTSAYFQESFASAYKSYVVGKKINGLQLGAVAGASDTTQAFDEALSKIANEAQS